MIGKYEIEIYNNRVWIFLVLCTRIIVRVQVEKAKCMQL